MCTAIIAGQSDMEIQILNNGIAWTILVALPLIAIAAFSLENRYTYGIQDRGLAKHRKKFRIIGRVATAASVLVFALMAISMI